ncbi:MAG: homocysteine biosynthesis protein [Spirochaetota bacterium]
MPKSIQEINQRIREKKACVFTAEEIIPYVQEHGYARAAREVDVVTTGTFSPMCSSGAFLNVGHAAPRIRIQKAWLNQVPAYGGLAACDLYLGATELPEDDPANKVHPGRFLYGGGHVIEELVAGRDVRLQAVSYGTDCYPRRELDTLISLGEMNQAFLLNPRNCYQNYNVAVNLSDRVIYTYLGVLQPRMGNANYSSAGRLSPLLKDPFLRTIGRGTRIFLGGGVGYVAGEGTQHNPTAERDERGVPVEGAGTLCVTGDLKGMSTRYLRGVSMLGYGASLAVGIGVPIPVLDEELLRHAAADDHELLATVIDYAGAYPLREPETVARVSYRELRSGKITVGGREVNTASLSSYPMAVEIAGLLRDWIREGRFLLTEMVEPLPGPESGQTFKPLTIRPARSE